MNDLERDLRDMMHRKVDAAEHTPRATAQLVRRARVRRTRTTLVGAMAIVALLLGGFAAARSLSRNEALPPAEKDSNVSPFVDTWTTTDVDGRTRTMVIRASGEGDYEITVHNHLALFCSGAPSTLTGTAELIGSDLVIPFPDVTCADGSKPKVVDGFPLSAVLPDLTFKHDPESDILTNYSPFERRRDPGGNRGPIYNGLTLVWRRADAENRIGDVSGWITYGDRRGIWARDLSSPGDPADRVRLSSAPGTPIAWSRDGSKLLVERYMRSTVGLNGPDLFVLNSDGTETRLTDANGGAGGGSLSPDGSAVVYAVTGECWWEERCGAESENPSSAIYVADAEGGSPQVLLAAGSRRYPDPDKPGDYQQSHDGDDRFETAVQEPKWSPDGSQIAYFDGMYDWGHSLRVMDSDGTNMRVVVENSETLGAGHVGGLQWSPDSSQLAFSVGSRVYVVGVDGSGFRLVSDGEDPYWSPDGSHIAYAPETEDGGGSSLEIVRLDDLQVQNFGDGRPGPWTAEMEWSASAP